MDAPNMRKYLAHELTARQSLAMAEEMAKTFNCPIVWIAWLRSARWGEFVRSDTLHDWTGGRQTVLLFDTERAARRFIRHNQIGGDWQTQPYPIATITDTCTQHGVAWRQVDDATSAWMVPMVDLVCPHTGAIVRVPHAERLTTTLRPPTLPRPPYNPARIRWRMRRIADRIARALAEIP